jgi:hypothetical protein
MILYSDKPTKQVENELGIFDYLEKYQMFTAINDKFHRYGIRLSFPCLPNADNISTYQINYYKEILKNWERLYQEMNKRLNYAPAGQQLDTIIIPDIIVREEFDYDANIIFEVLKNDFIDVYVVEMKVDKIMHFGKELNWEKK